MISIITPTLNSEKYLENTIKSICKLTTPYEHIVVDGGSSDQTLEIASKYSHVKILKQVDGMGMYSAIHQGFLNSKYDIITWINSDDSIIAENYEKAIKLFFNSKYDLIYGDAYFIYSESNYRLYIKGNKYGKYFLKKGILPFVQPSSLFRKSMYLKEQFNFKDFKICGDLDLFQRFSKYDEFKIYYIELPLTYFLKHGNSLGDLNVDKYNKELILLESNPSIFHKILFKLSRIL